MLASASSLHVHQSKSSKWTYSNGFTSELDFSSFIHFVEMWWLLISSTPKIPWSEYLNQKYKYQSLQNHIFNIVQHSHLYNSFLLIIVTCIVILLVAILYRDHVGFCVIVTFSSIHKLKWPVLLSYLWEWNQTWSKYMYPAHIYTTQYKETKLHQSSRQKFGVPDVHQFCPSLVSFP
jgi:hypothetical protein